MSNVQDASVRRICTSHLLVAPLLNARSAMWHLLFGLKNEYFISLTFQYVVTSYKYHDLVDTLQNSRIMPPTPFLSCMFILRFSVSVECCIYGAVDVEPFCISVNFYSTKGRVLTIWRGFLLIQNCKALLTSSMLNPVRKQTKKNGLMFKCLFLLASTMCFCFAFSLSHPLSSMA